MHSRYPACHSKSNPAAAEKIREAASTISFAEEEQRQGRAAKHVGQPARHLERFDVQVTSAGEKRGLGREESGKTPI